MAKDSKPGRSGAARPPVIDLKADEIKEEGASSSRDAAAGGAAKGKAEDKPADKPGTSGKPAGKAAAASKKPGGGKSSEKKSSKTPAGEKIPAGPTGEKDAGPAAASDGGKSGGGKSGKAGLVAGALVGLIGLSAGGGAWLYATRGPASRTESLQERLAVVEKTLTARPAREAAGTAMRKELAALKSRLEALEKQNGELAGRLEAAGEKPLRAVAELRKRVEALTKIVNANARGLAEARRGLNKTAAELAALGVALEKAADGAPAGAAVKSANVALKLEEARQAAAALRGRMEALEKAQEEMRATLGAARPAADLEKIAKRLEEQEAAIARLREETAALKALEARAREAGETAAKAMEAVAELKKNPPKPVVVPPPAGVAYAALRRKATTNAPFAEELKALEPWLPAMMELLGSDEIEKVAETGAPTRAALKKRLEELAAAYAEKRRAALEKARHSGLAGALKAQFSRVVKVRKADEADWPEALAEAKKTFEAGSLAGAMNLLKNQPGEKPKDIAEWIAGARKRMIVEKALSDIGEAVMTTVMARGGGKAQ